MKHVVIVFAITLLLNACNTQANQHAIIETNLGDIEIMLYDETPLHKANFIKLAKEHYYDGLLFHRVIPGFVIQGGDPQSKDASPETFLGGGSPGYLINPEIGAPHFKGALAAARSTNPEKKSNGSQFYIVLGAPVTDQELDQWERTKGIKYNEAQRTKYKNIGGLPSLDADYTVFGEVVNGIEIVEKIINAPTNPTNRPLQNIVMKIRLK
ncbi:MAG: peptidylprolyl isomerase [Saprospiraceae bacterium]